jgi:hypothetical protein
MVVVLATWGVPVDLSHLNNQLKFRSISLGAHEAQQGTEALTRDTESRLHTPLLLHHGPRPRHNPETQDDLSAYIYSVSVLYIQNLILAITAMEYEEKRGCGSEEEAKDECSTDSCPEGYVISLGSFMLD